MNVRSTHEKTLKMVQIAFLAAIEIVLTMIPISLGGLQLNLGLIPIIISGILFGAKAGFFIGLVNGICIAIQLFYIPFPLYPVLLSASTLLAILLCLLKSSLAGFLSGLVYALVTRACKNRTVNALVASAICPIVNTGVFAIGMLTVFRNALMTSEEYGAVSATTVGLFSLVFLTFCANFFVELISTMVITPTVSNIIFDSNLVKKNK